MPSIIPNRKTAGVWRGLRVGGVMAGIAGIAGLARYAAVEAKAQTQTPAAPAAASASKTAPAPAAEWKSLFDGKTLGSWGPSEFETGGQIKIDPAFRGGAGAILIEAGTTLSGITWQRGGELPRTNYELSLEAMKTEGDDFFCGLTFPVGKAACSFIVGGWGGRIVGLSSVDHSDASDNDTTSAMDFDPNRWYRIRVRVTDAKIETWIDDKQIVDLETAGRTISLRPGDIQKSLPLGIATYMTSAAVRDIRLRRL